MLLLTFLQVFPDIRSIFFVSLHGTWALNRDHKLQFTVSGQVSTIDGFIQDPRGRFMYHFFNKQNQLQESILGFVGQWDKGSTSGGDPTLTFTYAREDGSTGTFTLPKSVAINRSLNQLMYEYNKDNRTFRVQFSGFLSMSPTFQLTYAIDRQVARNGEQQVASTAITLDAVFSSNSFTGDLELTLKRDNGSLSTTTLTIAGNFTALLGPAQLQVGFGFSQVRSGTTITNAFAFNGALTLTNVGELQWQFTTNSQSTTLSLTGHVQLKDGVRLDSRLVLTAQNGKVASITGMFGISF